MNSKSHFFLIAFMMIAAIPTGAQEGSQTIPLLDAGQINLAREIREEVMTAFIRHDEETITSYPGLLFRAGTVYRGTIPDQVVTKTALVKCRIINSGQGPKSLYFFPGFYFTRIQLYRDKRGQLEPLPDIRPKHPESSGFRLFTVSPGDTMTLVAELDFLKTYINKIRPRLVSPEYLIPFISGNHDIGFESDLFTYIFCGLLLMMILYSLSGYFQGANKEFLFYSGYAIFIGLMLLTKALYNYHTEPLNYFLEEYLDFILQSTGIIFYMMFMQRFLSTKDSYPFLHKLYNSGILLLVFSMIAYTLLHYATDLYHLEFLVEFGTKMLLLALTFIFLLYSSRNWANKLFRYLFWGNLIFLLFSLFSLLLIVFPTLVPPYSLIGNSLIHYEAGLFFELVFFLAGLNYKNRRRIIAQTRERESLKAKTLLQEYEKELAVYKAQQEERQRISADMHDELGSGMTAIRLMSEIARNKMKENTPAEIEKISQSADEVLNKMNAIIWSMNSSNDTLDSLISYIRAWSQEYFESTSVSCRVHTPEQVPAMELTGDKRRNVFLCVKESLNNILKHAAASAVAIDITVNSELVIRISDNGKGIDKENIRQFGNGLRNINRRMESIGGRFTIENKEGTITTLSLPL